MFLLKHSSILTLLLHSLMITSVLYFAAYEVDKLKESMRKERGNKR